MNVMRQVYQVFVFIHQDRAKTALEHRSLPVLLLIDRLHIRSKQAFHHPIQAIILGRF